MLLADGTRLEADLVVLCAGSIGSPSILMRSGIGPRKSSTSWTSPSSRPRRRRQEPARPPDGVPDVRGRRRRGRRTHPAPADRPHLLRGWPRGRGDVDLHAVVLTMEPGRLLVPLVIYRHTPRRHGDRLPRPGGAPRIRLGLFDHPDDLRRMVAGIRHMRTIMESAPLQNTSRPRSGRAPMSPPTPTSYVPSARARTPAATQSEPVPWEARAPRRPSSTRPARCTASRASTSSTPRSCRTSRPSDQHDDHDAGRALRGRTAQ
ncbi:hypothetical protein StrepF001_39520 [Streptomyces sp. F001]|nr:hypothetical protein StrepF001_39520 [Streptomyces sp. F001]